MKPFVLLPPLIFSLLFLTGASSPRFAVVTGPAPVFHTSAFAPLLGGDGQSPKRDSCGQVRELEFVALPGTAVTVEELSVVAGRKVARIATAEYPSPPQGLYLDAAFLEMRGEKPPERRPPLPSRREVSDRLLAAVGAPYVWGGNVRQGIPALLDQYPPPAGITNREKNDRILAGLDCSGLLYEATGGFTPRNTSELVSFGAAVPVSGLGAEGILARLKPLDLIVWRGHVIIVLDRERTIESRLLCGEPGNGGVVVRPLLARIREVMKTRQPVNDDRDATVPAKGKFVVRRWLE